ncbi:hypothetical protein D7V97_03420 [Corallococcus sp. CA053C]|uniref:hypothetical protein n=1 Tax=Corallococcus sp. CA053C TaxID=2316732 RepID=UPI000EA02AF7|nr:hypothetical protein [Corallococcus sp. CA053C]RKH14242.1 hypothetical protein D7V97_03420 [Corallococcus sp. CA053C]
MPPTPEYERLEAIEDLLDEHRLLIDEQLAVLSWQEQGEDLMRGLAARAKTSEARGAATRISLALVAYQAFSRRLLLTYRHHEQGLRERLETHTPEAR